MEEARRAIVRKKMAFMHTNIKEHADNEAMVSKMRGLARGYLAAVIEFDIIDDDVARNIFKEEIGEDF